MNDFDVIIIGTGMVGLSTACALGEQSLRVAVVDDKVITTALPQQPTIRASAINASSQRYFSHLGVWDELLASNRVLSFDEISVREVDGFAALRANSRDYNYHELGHIIENEVVVNTLYNKARSYPTISFFQQKAVHLFSSHQYAFVQLTDNTQLTAKLIIAADGANSWVRKTANIALWQYHYRHHALIATVKTEKAHEGCARQLFYPDGIIAFLPLWQPNLSCLVWSAKPDAVSQLVNHNDNTFNHALTEATEGWLGDCELTSQRQVFPLTARYTPHFVQHRLILIGDAAHTIHPLAGQGVNLGLRDSHLLAQTIRRLCVSDKDIGLTPYWRDYQFARHKDVLFMLAAMQGIESMFNGQFILKKWLRGIGMNMVDQVPIIKKSVIKYALGL